VAYKRSAIRKFILRKGILWIDHQGSRWKRGFSREASWTAAQLEKVGYSLERVPET